MLSPWFLNEQPVPESEEADAEDDCRRRRCLVRRAGSGAEFQSISVHGRLSQRRGQHPGPGRCRFSAREGGLSLLVSDRVDGGHLPGQSQCRHRGWQGLGDCGDRTKAGRTDAELRHPLWIGRPRSVRRSHGHRAAAGGLHRSGERSSSGLGAGSGPARPRCGKGWQAPGSAAGLRRRDSGWLSCRPLDDDEEPFGRARPAAGRRPAKGAGCAPRRQDPCLGGRVPHAGGRRHQRQADGQFLSAVGGQYRILGTACRNRRSRADQPELPADVRPAGRAWRRQGPAL